MDEQRQKVFSDIFHNNSWRGKHSVSGPGSSLAVTAPIRRWLPGLFDRHNIRSLVDAPCGDGVWIQDVLPSLESYVGLDIVPELIETARSNNTHRHVSYEIADVVSSLLPKTDAIFCRDCLVHLSLDDGVTALRNMKASGARMLIATTFTHRENLDHKKPGAWRPLNLEKPPYPLGRPVEIFYERAPNRADKNNDKALGVWSFVDMSD